MNIKNLAIGAILIIAAIYLFTIMQNSTGYIIEAILAVIGLIFLYLAFKKSGKTQEMPQEPKVPEEPIEVPKV